MSQEIEAGKKIVKGILAKLADDLNRTEINNLYFAEGNKDFDDDKISILGQGSKTVVMKVKKEDLEDCPADISVRRKLEAQLKSALKAYYGTQCT
ncbi:MAG: hypothetical protein ABSE82_10500 [Nitrososphaerales archaeon]|jgi:hypothetical protein